MPPATVGPAGTVAAGSAGTAGTVITESRGITLAAADVPQDTVWVATWPPLDTAVRVVVAGSRWSESR